MQFIARHIPMNVRSYVDMDLHISVINSIVLEWQGQPVWHPGYREYSKSQSPRLMFKIEKCEVLKIFFV